MNATRRWLLQAVALSLLRPESGRAAVSLTRDRLGRLVVPVEINGRGPFRFALDTAANRSMLSTQLAADLGLRVSRSPAIIVQGSIGSQPLEAVAIDSLVIDQRRLGALNLGLLSPAQLAGADGLLGADGLEGAVLDLDLQAARISLAAGAVSPPHASRVRAERRFGSLLLLHLQVGGTPLPAILDTGAQRSIGNRPLQRALALRATGTAADTAVITAVGGTTTTADIITTSALRIGAIQLRPARLLFADLPVFRQWNLDQRPALLLGMDLIGELGRVSVDYRRTRVLVWR